LEIQEVVDQQRQRDAELENQKVADQQYAALIPSSPQ
jgi:hypothetical protein